MQSPWAIARNRIVLRSVNDSAWFILRMSDLVRIARSGTERGAAPGAECSSITPGVRRRASPLDFAQGDGVECGHAIGSEPRASFHTACGRRPVASQQSSREWNSGAVDKTSTVLLIQCSTVLRRSRLVFQRKMEARIRASLHLLTRNIPVQTQLLCNPFSAMCAPPLLS
jgi:hypothetical protein